MPTLEETRTTVLAAIEAYWQEISEAQSSRLAARGSYLQRKATHSIVPADGIPSEPDNVSDTPSDESEDGTEYMIFPPLMHTCATISVSDGPDGKAFKCIFEFDWSETGMRQRYEITGPIREDSGWSEYDPNATLGI